MSFHIPSSIDRLPVIMGKKFLSLFFRPNVILIGVETNERSDILIQSIGANLRNQQDIEINKLKQIGKATL
jgi:hypothetical protein